MAAPIHTTAGPGGDPPMLSRRASLLAAAFALPVLAPSVAAAAPAPPAEPDAELLRLAAEVWAREARLNAAGAVSDDEADAELAHIGALVARMAAIPAAGMEGIAAKAQRMAWHFLPRQGGSLPDAEFPLAASIFADLARLRPVTMAPMPAIEPAQHPDAALLTLGANLRAADAATEAACRAMGAVEFGDDLPAWEAADDALNACHEAFAKVLAELAATPAAGFAGLAVKAARLREALASGACLEDHRVASSLTADAARLAGCLG